MSHAWRRRWAATLSLWALWPVAALGQSTPALVPAGTVSTLQGHVTATRATAPRPLPLKFRDDVFLQDRIATGDQSTARILLGGKALVTIRERSALTITEAPGRSTLALETGKLALAVAREKMRAGDSVDIRTANAIAAVRGTVVVVEVQGATAQAPPGPGSAPIVTNVYVLSDPTRQGVLLSQLDPGTQRVIQQVTLTAGQGFSLPGAASGRSVAIPPTVTAGLETPVGSHHRRPANQQLLTTGQMATAVVLAQTLLGDRERFAPAAAERIERRTGEDTDERTRARAPILPANRADGFRLIIADAPEVEISGTRILEPGEALIRVNGNFVRAGASPVVRVNSGSTVIGSEDLIDVGFLADVLLAAPVLAVRQSAVTTTGDVLDVRGDLVSGTAAALLGFDPTTVNAANLVSVGASGTISTAGSLVAADDTTFTLTGSLIDVTGGRIAAGGHVLVATSSGVTAARSVVAVSDGGNVTSNAALVALSDSSLSITGDAVSLANAGTLSTNGPPLLASLNGVIGVGGAVLHVEGGVAGTSTATFRGPMLTSTGDALTVGGDVIEVNTRGVLVRLADTSAFMRFSGTRVAAGVLPGVHGHLLFVNNGGAVLLNGPLAEVAAAGVAPWSVKGLVFSRSVGDPAVVIDTNSSEPLVSFAGAPTAAHAIAPNPGFSMFDLIGTNTVAETDPDASPLTVGSDEPLRHGGRLFQADLGTAVTTNQFFRLDTALFDASRPLLALTAGSALTSATDLVHLVQRAKLSGTIVPGDALVTLNASNLTVNARSLVNVGNDGAGGSFMSISGGGSLIRLENGSTLTLNTSLNGALVTVTGGSVFKLAGGGSLGVFGAGSNQINITNLSACGGCTFVPLPNFGPAGVALLNGANGAGVITRNGGTAIIDPGFVPFTNLGGTNTVRLNGPSAAIAIVDGAGSKLKLGP